MELETVADLIDPTECNWDAEAIKSIFNQRDTELILKIPIPRQQVQDKIIWGPEVDGKFSVKSCYKAIHGVMPESESKNWSRFWQCKIPHKVKTFLWQACTMTLPTKDSLRAKRVNCDDKCQLCLSGKESVFHLFVECDYAKACWSYLRLQCHAGSYTNFQDWMSTMSTSLSNTQACTLYIVCWKI